jgi:hypothetical protein
MQRQPGFESKASRRWKAFVPGFAPWDYLLSPLQDWNEAHAFGPRVYTQGYFLPPPTGSGFSYELVPFQLFRANPSGAPPGLLAGCFRQSLSRSSWNGTGRKFETSPHVQRLPVLLAN